VKGLRGLQLIHLGSPNPEKKDDDKNKKNKKNKKKK
jgi:hypothetical protein